LKAEREGRRRRREGGKEGGREGREREREREIERERDILTFEKSGVLELVFFLLFVKFVAILGHKFAVPLHKGILLNDISNVYQPCFHLCCKGGDNEWGTVLGSVQSAK